MNCIFNVIAVVQKYINTLRQSTNLDGTAQGMKEFPNVAKRRRTGCDPPLSCSKPPIIVGKATCSLSFRGIHRALSDEASYAQCWELTSCNCHHC